MQLVPARRGRSGGRVSSSRSCSACAAQETCIYWTWTASDYGSGGIGEANLDGTNINQSFITGLHAPQGVAVNGQRISWRNYDTGAIGEANLDGTDVNQNFITGGHFSVGVAADDQHVYWSNYETGTLGEANVDGTQVNQHYIPGAAQAGAVAANGQHIYWVYFAAAETPRSGRRIFISAHHHSRARRSSLFSCRVGPTGGGRWSFEGGCGPLARAESGANPNRLPTYARARAAAAFMLSEDPV